MNDTHEKFHSLTVKSNVAESTLIKLLKGFDIDRSYNGSNLTVFTSNKEEQSIALSILELLIPKDRISSSCEKELIITHADDLRRKLEKRGIDIKIEIKEIVRLISTQAEIIRYSPPGMLDENQYKLSVHFVNENTLDELVEFLKKSRINTNREEYVSNQITGQGKGFLFYGEDADRIATRLADNGVNFEGAKYLSRLNIDIIER